MVNGLGQQLGKLLVVEDLQATSAGNLAHSCGVEVMVVVTVTTLDEDTAVAQALCVHLPSNVIQVNACQKRDNGLFNSKKHQHCGTAE